jgi:hypothetical protein
MRAIVFVFMIIISLFANDIDDLLLIEAKLYPKIVLLDKKIVSNKIKIGIIYDEKSKTAAEKLKKFLSLNNTDAVLIKKEQIKQANADAFVIGMKNIDENSLNQLLLKHKLIFSLFPQNIKNSMISLDIGVKIKPVLNLKLIKIGGVSLNPIIFKVAEIYNEK